MFFNTHLVVFFMISCFSAIGRQGGKQRISVGEGCEYKGTVMHEMMHALGFFHEQSRTDRDDYIMVLWWNIEPGMVWFYFIAQLMRCLALLTTRLRQRGVAKSLNSCNRFARQFSCAFSDSRALSNRPNA